MSQNAHQNHHYYERLADELSIELKKREAEWQLSNEQRDALFAEQSKLINQRGEFDAQLDVHERSLAEAISKCSELTKTMREHEQAACRERSAFQERSAKWIATSEQLARMRQLSVQLDAQLVAIRADVSKLEVLCGETSRTLAICEHDMRQLRAEMAKYEAERFGVYRQLFVGMFVRIFNAADDDRNDAFRAAYERKSQLDGMLGALTLSQCQKRAHNDETREVLARASGKLAVMCSSLDVRVDEHNELQRKMHKLQAELDEMAASVDGVHFAATLGGGDVELPPTKPPKANNNNNNNIEIDRALLRSLLNEVERTQADIYRIERQLASECRHRATLRCAMHVLRLEVASQLQLEGETSVENESCKKNEEEEEECEEIETCLRSADAEIRSLQDDLTTFEADIASIDRLFAVSAAGVSHQTSSSSTDLLAELMSCKSEAVKRWRTLGQLLFKKEAHRDEMSERLVSVQERHARCRRAADVNSSSLEKRVNKLNTTKREFADAIESCRSLDEQMHVLRSDLLSKQMRLIEWFTNETKTSSHEKTAQADKSTNNSDQFLNGSLLFQQIQTIREELAVERQKAENERRTAGELRAVTQRLHVAKLKLDGDIRLNSSRLIQLHEAINGLRSEIASAKKQTKDSTT